MYHFLIIFFFFFYLLNLFHTNPNPQIISPPSSLSSEISPVISPSCFSWLLLLHNLRFSLPLSSHHLHSLTHFLISLTNTHIYPPLSFHMKLKLQQPPSPTLSPSIFPYEAHIAVVIITDIVTINFLIWRRKLEKIK